METPFYHDDVLSGLGTGFAPSSGSTGLLLPFPGGSMMKKDALGMALPEQVAAALKAPGASSGEAAGLLGSAELGLLKLASPELERLIIQSNGLVTTTPTTGQFLYPKAAASEEQEFAEGFVKALEDLHKQNQLGAAAASSAVKGRASDRPGGAELRGEPSALPHRHGHAGADQGGTEAAEESHRRFQVPQEEAGADLPPGGEGEEPQEPEHGAGLHRQPAPGAGRPAQAEGPQPRQQRLPAPAAAPAPGPRVLTLDGPGGRPLHPPLLPGHGLKGPGRGPRGPAGLDGVMGGWTQRSRGCRGGAGAALPAPRTD
uniref:JunD proto-oncogene, AP-1 transcription factor subunit n=1 Tax=Amazona collaria TaxID=241587 RepID=A0A8B9F3M2_9PSIT